MPWGINNERISYPAKSEDLNAQRKGITNFVHCVYQSESCKKINYNTYDTPALRVLCAGSNGIRCCM